MDSSAGSAKSGIYTAWTIKRWLVLGLYPVIVAYPLLGHAQVPPSTTSPGRATVVTTIPACAPGWSDRLAAPIKITDSLVVSVPVKYIRYEMLTCGEATDGVPRDAPSNSTSASFEFFLPDFDGFTDKTLHDPFAPNEVKVAHVISEKNEFGPKVNYIVGRPSDQLKNMLAGSTGANPNKYRDMFGLRCYADKILTSKMWCYSAQAGEDHEGIFFDVDVQLNGRGVPNPLMRTEYFSQRYGGIEVSWWTSAENMSHWREIDAQIWKFLAAWNVVQTAK